MGVFDKLKEKLGSSNKVRKDEELGGYLKAARDNLKLASDSVAKFLDGVRDFQPARRHEPLYYEEVKEKLVNMRGGMNKGLVFLDERLKNTINTLGYVKNYDQLKDMLDSWSKSIQANDDKVYDILKILQVEMWDQEKIKRGFPVPHSKDMLCGYLISAVAYMRDAKASLENYNASNVVVN